MNHCSFFISLALMMLVTYTEAYPDRIPVDEHPEICESMDPSGHNTTALTGESPYRIIYNTEGCYSDQNQKIYVTVYHVMEKGFFEGIFLQARNTDGSRQSLGTFDSNGDNMFQAYSCGGFVNNTFGHRGHDHFFKTVLTWTPPAGLDNDVQFVATMVRSTFRYWLNVKSSVLSYQRTCKQFAVTDPPLISTTVSESPKQASSSSNSLLLSIGALVYVSWSLCVLH